MPQFQVTTKSANQVWKSPDGQRELYEVIMDYEGQEVKAKSWSKAVATVGFAGEVETYEKDGKQGMETFVKQAPKEGGYPPRSTGSSSGRSSYVPKDEKAIQAMWAIGQANNSIEKPSENIEDVEAYAIEMMLMVDRVKTELAAVPEPESKPSQDDDVVETTGDEDQTSLLDDVKDMFPGSEEVKPSAPEKPWPKNS